MSHFINYYAERHYAECRYAECHYTERCDALAVGLSRHENDLAPLGQFINLRHTEYESFRKIFVRSFV